MTPIWMAQVTMLCFHPRGITLGPLVSSVRSLMAASISQAVHHMEDAHHLLCFSLCANDCP
jgi:hypothetical protein